LIVTSNPFSSARTGDEERPGSPRRVRGWLGPLVTIALFAAAPGGAASPQSDAQSAAGGDVAPAGELARLLAGFAAMPGITARFREERHLALLAAPLVSHGEIAFSPPDRLRRQVTDPVESLMLVRDGEMVLRDPHGSRAIDLSSQPMVQIFVDGITLLLAGDLDGLLAHYRMRFEPGDAERGTGWSLQLEPRVSPLDEVIASISFGGRGQELESLVVIETSGDETRTRFSEVDGGRHFSKQEIERLFHPPEPPPDASPGPSPGLSPIAIPSAFPHRSPSP
jgi:hypothetical protein